MDTINIQYLLWSVNTGKIGQVWATFKVSENAKKWKSGFNFQFEAGQILK
ncbi:MAG: hypothetical protein LC660_17750 [Desulfobacteraceae bacterium]|nr:hypothetical protein [Desulfobacteraceae bacterium]